MDQGSDLESLFFEGPEKLLEIWFIPTEELDADPPDKKRGLRSIARAEIEGILALVKCAIISVKSNDYFDAYLLSESSLFVWSHKIILKTCGTTTLLLSVPRILEVAKRDCGLTVIGNVFYSRRNFFEDKKQKEPHGSFQDEVTFLEKIVDGSAYLLGKKNGDHWYLFVTDKGEYSDNSAEIAPSPLPSFKPSKVLDGPPDFTLEILMTELPRDVMKQFYKNKNSAVSAEAITESSGIAGLIPGAILDSYIFDPMGYSMNGLLDAGYYTIHITPQEKYSYASFETNIECDYAALMGRVLKIFRPGTFTVTLFAGNLPHEQVSKILADLWACPILRQFVRLSKMHSEFENHYELAFGHFVSPRDKDEKEKAGMYAREAAKRKENGEPQADEACSALSSSASASSASSPKRMKLEHQNRSEISVEAPS